MVQRSSIQAAADVTAQFSAKEEIKQEEVTEVDDRLDTAANSYPPPDMKLVDSAQNRIPIRPPDTGQKESIVQPPHKKAERVASQQQHVDEIEMQFVTSKKMAGQANKDSQMEAESTSQVGTQFA